MDNGGLLQFWAKKKAESDGAQIRYPLLYHMLDGALVARAMWDSCFQDGVKRFCTRQLGTDETQVGQLVSFWVGLHDIGKASPGFQCQDEGTKQGLRKQGFDISGTSNHGVVTAALLKDFLKHDVDPHLARMIGVAVGGHHGVFPRSEEIQEVQTGRRGWPGAQRAVYDAFCRASRNEPSLLVTADPTPALFMILAGFTSVADWIASNEAFFPIDHPQDASLEDHAGYARGQAEKALAQLFWAGWQPPPNAMDFGRLFPRLDRARPLQTQAVSLAKVLSGEPGLVIIEAPMGEGKTEAAMYLADSWAAGLRQKGCYFALPTMATSDQMFGRVKTFLETRYPEQSVGFMLLHGHAALSAEFEALKDRGAEFRVCNVGDKADEGYDHASAGIVASEWFTSRKRGLLAPFGVGTIDQALLAVLQTRHVFVRLFGLAGKTIIIDEVHAYDTYMTTLLERLLEWLAALGSSVVMLSATLPRGRKDTLLKAYAKGLGQSDASVPAEVTETRYPRLSWTNGDSFHATSIDTSDECTKTLRLCWVNGEIPSGSTKFELGVRLQEVLAHGGCAAVICNTVDRAQEVYSALKLYFDGVADDGQPVLDLLHARYLFGDRKDREERCLARFGKPGGNVRRPGKAVLVATQVIEQSLDLDFDLMVTDIAPIDLLLQRAGRMHRHQRATEERHGLKEPTLWVCQPQVVGQVPDFGDGTEAVYDYHVLLRSWLAIRDIATIRIPEDIEELIEKVYDEKRPCPQHLSEALKEKWAESRERLEERKGRYKAGARQNRILPPDMDSESLLESFNKQLEEDDPTQYQSLQALTRYSEQPTASVICFFGSKNKPSLDADGTDVVDLDSRPDAITTRIILMRSCSLSNRRLVDALIKRKEELMVPKAWREVPLLRHHFILFFDRNYTCGDFVIRLDEELGLVLPRQTGS